MAQAWYAFRAYNSQAIYGFGTADEADRYSDHLNRNREIDLYGAHELTEAEATERRLEDNTEAFDLDGALTAIAEAAGYYPPRPRQRP